MMRPLIAIVCALSSAATCAGNPRYGSLPADPDADPAAWATYDRLAEELPKHPPMLTEARLPAGMKIGRCLLQVKGRTLIRGRCAYSIAKDGEFEINGPRQVYAGIDYPAPGGMPLILSTDHFVQVEREILDGGATGAGWWAYWNEDKRATHAQWFLGSVTKRGACYVNKEAKICLWKK